MDDLSTGSGLVGDASPNLNHLTLTGASWMETAGNGGTKTRYISFDGVNDFLSRTFDADYDFGTSDFTLAGLFRHPLTVSGTDTIISRYGSAGWKVYINSSGFLCFGIDDDSTWGPDDSACSTVSYVDNKWHSFSAVKGASSITLYVDGSQVAIDSTLSALSSLSTASPLYIGIDFDGTSNPWTGYLDEFAIYPYARTATQVKTDNLGQQLSVLIGSYENDNLTDGLIAWWKLDETSGTSVIDSSGNGITGTATTPAIATGKFANARDFVPANNDYVTFGTNSKMNEANGFTFASWVYTDAYTHGYPTLYKKGDYGASLGFLWIYQQNTAPGNIYYAYATGTTATSKTLSCGLTSGKWEHLVVTLNRANKSISCYVNGVLKDTEVYTGTMLPAISSQAQLGKYGASSTHDGRLDEVRLYSRPLDSNEAVQLYEWNPPPVVHWNLDDGTGQYANDASGNANVGTLGSGATADAADPVWTTGKYGKAVNFDGGDYIEKTDPASGILDVGTGNFTACTWINNKQSLASDNFYYPLVSKKSNQNGSYVGWMLWLHGGINKGLELRMNAGGQSGDVLANPDIDVKALLSDGAWHHVCVSVDRTNEATFFVDGMNKGGSSVASESLTLSNAVSFVVGATSDKAYKFTGLIDDVKVYNYARSQKQIVADMLSSGPVVSAAGSAVSSTGGKPNGAVAWYKFDEGQGTVANNSGYGGSALNGTLTSMSAPATATSGWTNSGKFGKALNFDGSDDYVSLPDVPQLNITGDISISAWIKTNTTASSLIVGGYQSVSPYAGYGLGVNVTTSGKLSFGGGSSSWVESLSSVNDNQWHHVAVSLSGSTLIFYIDGKYDVTRTRLPIVAWNGTRIIGARSDLNGKYKGGLDEVKVYNFPLSPDQIKFEFNQSSALKLGSGNASDGVVLASDKFSTAGSTSTELPVLPWTGGVKSGGKMSVAPTLGSEMWDAGASTFEGSSVYGWIYGTATNVSNTLVTSYISAYLNSGSDLNSNLAIGTWYQYAVDRKINSGSATQSIYSNPTWEPGVTFTETTFTRKYQIFRAKHASDNQINYNAGAQVVTIDNLSFQPLTLSSLFSTVPTSDKDIVVSTDIISTDGTQAGIVANLNSASVPTAGVIAYLTRTNATTGAKVTLDKFTTATTWTNLIPATTVTYVAGAPLKVSTYHSDPNTLKVNVFYNNVQVGTEQTVTDASIINNTSHGLFSTYSGNTFDNFTLTTQPKNYSYSVPGSTELDLPPVAEWNMDDPTFTPSGGTAGQGVPDISGNANIGTLGSGVTADSSDPTWGTGKIGKGLKFDGVDDYVLAANSSTLNNWAALTASLWFKATPTQNAYARLIEKGANNEFTVIMNAGNVIAVDIGSATMVIQSTSTYNDNVWHHMSFTVSSSKLLSLYVDGVLIGTYQSSATPTKTHDLYIGQYGGGTGYNFSGSIDQVRIYNYARTPAQVAYDYNRGKPVAHWRFDEVSGVVANDASGNALAGTVSGANYVPGKFNNCLSFNGTSDFVGITSTVSINAVSFWMKQNTTSNKSIVDLGGGYTVTIASNAIATTGFSTPTVYIDGKAGTAITDTNWHLVTITTTTAFAVANPTIGKVSTNFYTGLLDDIQLYNYALTSTQVRDLYTGGTVRYGPN